MGVTSEQRADIGTRYVDEIKRRIKVREEAKVKVRNLPGSENPEVLAAAQADLNEMIGTSHKLAVRKVAISGHRNTADFYFKGGDYFRMEYIPSEKAKRAVALLTYSEAEERDRKKNQDLCRELEFLHGIAGGSAIGAFQSYCARLWAPAKKTDRLPVSEFKAHIEAFLNTKRGFTCTL